MLQKCLIEVGKNVIMKRYNQCAKIEDPQLDYFCCNNYEEENLRPRKSVVTLALLLLTKYGATQHFSRTYQITRVAGCQSKA